MKDNIKYLKLYFKIEEYKYRVLFFNRFSEIDIQQFINITNSLNIYNGVYNSTLGAIYNIINELNQILNTPVSENRTTNTTITQILSDLSRNKNELNKYETDTDNYNTNPTQHITHAFNTIDDQKLFTEMLNANNETKFITLFDKFCTKGRLARNCIYTSSSKYVAMNIGATQYHSLNDIIEQYLNYIKTYDIIDTDLNKTIQTYNNELQNLQTIQKKEIENLTKEIKDFDEQIKENAENRIKKMSEEFKQNKELETISTSPYVPPTDTELTKLFNLIDVSSKGKQSDGKISLDEMYNAIYNNQSIKQQISIYFNIHNLDEAGLLIKILNIFEKMDIDRNREIDITEFKNYFNKSNEIPENQVTEDEINKWITIEFKPEVDRSKLLNAFMQLYIIKINSQGKIYMTFIPINQSETPVKPLTFIQFINNYQTRIKKKFWKESQYMHSDKFALFNIQNKDLLSKITTALEEKFKIINNAYVFITSNYKNSPQSSKE